MALTPAEVNPPKGFSVADLHDLYDRLNEANDMLVACMKEAKQYRNEILASKDFEPHLTLAMTARRCVNAAQWIHACYLTPWINQRLLEMAQEPEDYDRKKEIASWLNDALKRYNLTIYHPVEKKPCILLAVGSRDKQGRYVIENRETKKRSGAYRSVADMIPVMIGVLAGEPGGIDY